MTDLGRSIAGRIRSARREMGLSAKEVAALAGCSERFIHQLEGGDRDPACMETWRFVNLSRALCVPMKFLYCGRE